MTQVYVQRALPRWLIVILGVAGTVIALAGIRSAAGLIAPIFLALMLVITVHPLLGWAQRRGMPQWLAVLLAVLAVYALIIGLALAVAYSIAQLAALLPQYSAQWTKELDGLRSTLSHLGVSSDQLQSAVKSINPTSVLGFISGLINGLLSATTSLLFVIAMILFMCVDGSTLPARLAAVPGASPELSNSLAGFAKGTRSYLLVTTVFGFIVAVIDTIALAIMGIPLPIVWGLLAFITNYVPNVGFILGLVPPALLGLLVGGPGLAVAVIVVYCLVNLVIQSIIQPKFIGDAVGLSVSVTFLSLILWAWILGPLGAILAVPMSLLAKAVLVDLDDDNRWARELVSSPSPAGTSAVVAAEDTADQSPASGGPAPDTAPDAGARDNQIPAPATSPERAATVEPVAAQPGDGAVPPAGP
jgi:predicted PurR-regulated permease PerM